MPSARSLLLTMLGEFVHPRQGEAWTGTLVDALGALGVEEKSARQALARVAGEGLMSPTRHGRRVRWHLTPAGHQLMREGTERIYGFMGRSHHWDGRWLVLTVGVPESQRQLRHRLRTRLTWLGMGSPAPGLWVVPDAGRAGAAADAVAEAGLGDRAFAWVGADAPALGDRAALLRAAWDLDAVETRYTTFLAAFTDRRAGTDDEAFVAQVQLVQAWRRFPFLDPGLPAELLDHTWPGLDAAAAFHRLHAEWSAPAQRCWQGLG